MAYSILVPFDFSTGAEAALAWAAELARARKGSIVLLHVVSLVPLGAASLAAPDPTAEDLALMTQQMRDAGLRHEVAVEVAFARGASVGQQIVEFVRGRAADLVVMGTHGRGGLGRAILGSAADHVVRHVDCPVVTLRHAVPTEREAERGAGADETARRTTR